MTIRFVFRENCKAKSWEPATLHIILMDGRSYRDRASSDISLPKELWDTKNQRISVRISYDPEQKRKLSKKIDALKTTLEERYYSDKAEGKIGKNWLAKTLESLKTEITAISAQDEQPLANGERIYGAVFDRFLSSKDIVENRKRHYVVIQGMLHRFEIYNRDICNNKAFILTPQSMDAAVLQQFEDYLSIEKLIVENNLETFKQYGFSRIPKERGQNFISTTMKELRALFNYMLDEEHLIKESPFSKYKIKQEIYGTPYYLTQEEVMKIYETDFLDSSRNKARDIFVFQCMTGPRVSDLWGFTPDNIIDGCLQYIPSKGIKGKKVADTVTVPLNATAKKIIKDNKALMAQEGDKRGFLLPFMSQGRYNIFIKELLIMAKIKRKVTVYDSKTGKEKQERICDLASSHMARRTFIGNLYQNVPDPNLIASMSGHSENSTSFNRYRKVSVEQKKNLVKLLDKAD